MELATLNVAYEFGVARLKRFGIKRLKAMFYMNDVFHASSVKQERGIDYPLPVISVSVCKSGFNEMKKWML